ncbi:MAG: aldehyde dehydrogenase family protein [Mycoplasma sp.]|nr:aldehyde dehydrogenase family protein [Mycoplasma sp.]
MSEFLYSGKAYINGEFIDTEEKLTVISAIDGSKIGTVPSLKEEDVRYAYQAANNAFLKWSTLSHSDRVNKIKLFAEYFLEEKEFLANLMCLEIAKNYKDSLTEIERTYEYIQQTIEIYEKEFTKPVVMDENIHNIKGKVGKFYNVPIGVVLAVAPFNYPINLGLAKIIPTLLVGNTVIFKPATYGSLVSSQISKYFDKAGLPNGVLNVVIGKGSEIGDALVENKYVKGITFTGSSDIGAKIAQQAAFKNLVLELGGKDAAIVLDDVDVEVVAKEIVKGAFNYSGQRCTAIKRVIVLNKIADELVIALKNEIEKLSVGSPLDNSFIVPLIDKKSFEYNLSLIEDAKKTGAKLVTGAKVVGYNLIEPTLFDHVPLNSKLAWEEPFGPILPVIRVNKISEAIAITNSSNYGLQGSVFSNNVDKAILIAKHLETGTVNINRSSSRGPDIFPFIGVKESGFGVQGIRDSLKAMTRIKGIVENY